MGLYFNQSSQHFRVCAGTVHFKPEIYFLNKDLGMIFEVYSQIIKLLDDVYFGKINIILIGSLRSTVTIPITTFNLVLLANTGEYNMTVIIL